MFVLFQLTMWSSTSEGATWSHPKVIMSSFAWYGGLVAGLAPPGHDDLGWLWSTGPGPPDSVVNSVIFGPVSSTMPAKIDDENQY